MATLEEQLAAKFEQVRKARDAYEEADVNLQTALIGINASLGADAFEAAKTLHNRAEESRDVALIIYKALVDDLLELWRLYHNQPALRVVARG